MSTPADAPLAIDPLLALLQGRRSVAPKRLHAPGPDAAQLQQLLAAAATAPDHRSLAPWRLIRIADHQRPALADLFEACARDRQPPPGDDHLARAREKAARAPLLLLAVLRTEPPDPEVPPIERAVALGAALMAMLVSAHAMGFGAMVTSGRAVRSARLAQAFGLAAHEQAVCFVSIGTPKAARAHPPRPPAGQRLSDWAPPAPQADA